MPFTAAPVTLDLASFPVGLRFLGHAGEFTLALDSSKAPAVCQGPTPVQLMMLALGGCTAMDVISILRKKRLEVTGYHVTVSGERRDEHPKIFTDLRVLHTVHKPRGGELSREAVEGAVELSHSRYCTVSGQIGGSARISHLIEIVEDGEEQGR